MTARGFVIAAARRFDAGTSYMTAQALEYERLARQLQERTATVVDMFMRAHLYPGCMRPRLLVSGPDADASLDATSERRPGPAAEDLA